MSCLEISGASAGSYPIVSGSRVTVHVSGLDRQTAAFGRSQARVSFVVKLSVPAHSLILCGLALAIGCYVRLGQVSYLGVGHDLTQYRAPCLPCPFLNNKDKTVHDPGRPLRLSLTPHS